MEYKIGKSRNTDAAAAVREACEGLRAPKFIWFASGTELFEACTQELKAMFPAATVMGTTTIAVFCPEGAFKDTLQVLGIESGIECVGDVLEEADRCPLKYVKRLERCADSIGDGRGGDTICFEVSTGLIGFEELVLSTLNSVLLKRKIAVFGGTAGDRGRAEKTMVSFNGRVYDKSCVFVLLRNLGGPIHLYRENIYVPMSDVLQATKVDVRQRRVLEFDGQPAAIVEAGVHGIEPAAMGAKILDSYPLGRLVGNEMYIVANETVEENQRSMRYHARIYENSEVVVLKPADYRAVNQETIAKVRQEVPRPALSIMVNCLARTLLFEGDGYLDEFTRSMGTALGSYVGFGGYGEQLREQHFNQTMILAVFE